MASSTGSTPTLGVEEEFLLVDPSTGAPVALNRAVAKGTESDETASIGFRRIGKTGGSTLFGKSVDEMRAAHQSFFADWMEG